MGPGYVHVPRALVETDEFEQMTAARLLPVVVQGKPSMRWITPAGRREEGGDCMVYAYAAACHLGIQNFREPSWARREAKFCPTVDLFSAPAAALAEAAAPSTPVSAATVPSKSSPPPATPPPSNRSGLNRSW